MSRNGSGLFQVNSTGQPVVANTLIESSVFNAFTADVATALSASIASDGQTTITANLPMAGFKHTGVGDAAARTQYASAGQVQDGKLNWVDGGGTADAITATYVPAITALVDGQMCFVRATAANATATPTFAPNGLTARTIVQRGGSALIAGNISGDGHELALRYDLANTRWELLNPAITNTTLGAAALSGATFTGPINEARGSIAMHATTMDIWAQPNIIDGTGSAVTITAIANAPQAGARRVLYPITGTTITNGATFAVDGAGNYTTAAGDALEFEAVTTSTYKVHITKKDGTAISGGASSVTTPPAVRQTVLSGPVDTNGFSAFGGSTGSTTVTASGTLKPTAAYVADNRTGSITNPSWTGLSTNGTMYLYLDIDSVGVCTTGSTTLAPTYRWGGADVVTNNQNTFNIQEMTMKVGNGTTASQVWRVFVGEVTVAGGVTTAITWYALMGRYVGPWTNTLPTVGTAISQNHNIGDIPLRRSLQIKNITAEIGYIVGYVSDNTYTNGGGTSAIKVWTSTKAIGFTTGNTVSFSMENLSSGATTSLTLANWAYRMTADRGW